MSTESPANEGAGTEHNTLGDPKAAKLNPPLERSRFGGTARRPERPEDDDAPVSRSDLSKGPQELLEHRTARISWAPTIPARNTSS